MASNIGIKIANGEFYPILEENSLIKKRLVLSTVHDNQQSVQIDLYRNTAKGMTDAQYIGSVVVENIKPKPKGDPSIELIISSNKNGEIIADAIDLDTGMGAEHQVLTVSLKSLDETSRDLEVNDFEMESNEEPPSGLYEHAKEIRQHKKRRSLAWLFILIALILILGLIGAWLFYFGGMETVSSKISDFTGGRNTQQEPVRQPVAEPVREVETTIVVIEPEPVLQIVEPAPVIQASPDPPPAPSPQPAVQRRPAPPVASYNVPAVIPREGVNYVIRWGDTLWDISEAFYRDPWQYPRIARHNDIRNPNYIISGRTIRVPPRN